ncbi:hypothetical protein B0H63DRAFT_76389 [Podospora didyma]|uniref:Rhodopsin domain-containing protein n=1 Tax=Podospora didyma TaxID=330526 RepID=A0AAE0K2M4_9PEZI|nr:hypothetical protein B0H63DRAFT_76389 [Podospora didyma]
MADPTGGMGGPPPLSVILATPSPPTPAANALAHSFGAAAVALNIISFLLFSGRIYTRSYPVFRMGWEDYVISIAWVFVLANSILLILTTPYVFGGDPSTFTLGDVIYSNKLAVLSQPIWAWSMATIKIAVAGMLLRLEQKRGIRLFLWVMVGLQLVVALYATLASTLQCIPLEAAWDLLGLMTDAKCWSKYAIRTSSICVSSFNIVTDVIFALMPVTFLLKLQIPLRERIVIGILMALGIFASVASIIKANAAANFGLTDDPNLEGISMGTWSLVEEQVAFIAACIPVLRKPFQQVLQHFGLVTVSNTTAKKTAGSGYGRMVNGNGNVSNVNGAIRMKSMTSSRAQSEEDILGEERETPQHMVLGPNERGIWRTRETEVRLEEARDVDRDLEKM